MESMIHATRKYKDLTRISLISCWRDVQAVAGHLLMFCKKIQQKKEKKTAQGTGHRAHGKYNNRKLIVS
jgi:hypothetical protein